MSAVELMPDAPPIEEQITVPRRKFKASDLPLTPVQRSSIDSLLHTIKKKGEFDALRKKVWSQYADSVSLYRTQLSEWDLHVYHLVLGQGCNLLIRNRMLRRHSSPL